MNSVLNHAAMRPYQKLEMLAAVTSAPSSLDSSKAEMTLYRTTEGILAERIVFDIDHGPWANSYREHFDTDEDAVLWLETVYPIVASEIHKALLDAWRAKS